MQGRLVVRISPADVGSRVSVRTRIPAAGGQPGTTDTVGRLLAWAGAELRIERSDGSVAVLDAGDLLAGRVIPERPPRR